MKTFEDAERLGKSGFDLLCKELEKNDLKKTYDYSIIDEGQDFPIYFYRLCRKITKNDRLIWGYDECQNIKDIQIQNTIETFGKDSEGKPYIDFSRADTKDEQDIVLHKCYRNPRLSLVVAFALGLGIYGEKILQMPESAAHWEDLGFKIIKGTYGKINDKIVIVRPEENSPLIKNQLLDKEKNTFSWKIFESIQEECEFVVKNIENDLYEDLRPEDILVISLDDRHCKDYFKIISTKLLEKGYNVYDAVKAPSYSKIFKKDNCITLSTIYRAKGNEAASVHIVGIDSVFQYSDIVSERDKVFTAITRSYGWVVISGVGPNAKKFATEIKEIEKNQFQLIFNMPDLTKLKKMTRDLADKHAKLLEVQRYIDTKAFEMGIDREEFLQSLSRKKDKIK